MTRRGLCWTWFIGLWLLLPWPMIVFTEQWVPAVRYAILASVASAVALMEGAAGPVGPLVGLFLGWSLGTALGCWGIAVLASRLLARLPSRLSAWLTLALIVLAVASALALEPYHMHFGRAPQGGLLEFLS